MTSHAGFPGARPVAIRLLRGYPRPWRARYATEMRAMLDQMPVTWRQVADLFVGAVREWLSPRAFGWPSRSAAARVQSVRAWKFAAGAVLLEVAAHSLTTSTQLSAMTAAGFGDVATVGMMAATFRLLLGGLASRRRPRLLMRYKWYQALGGPLTSLEVAVWYAAMSLLLVDMHLEPIPAWVDSPRMHVFMNHLQVFMWAQLLFNASAPTLRLRRVLRSHVKRGGKSWLYRRIDQ